MGVQQRVLIGCVRSRSNVSLRHALEARGFACAEAIDCTMVIDVARRFAPDVALIDIDLPNDRGVRAGLRTASKLVATSPALAVIMLGDADPGEDLWNAMRAGASGYLPRDLAPAAIAASALGALAGEAAMSRVLVRRLIADLREPDNASDELTTRERDVLELLVKGQTTAEIADELFIAKVTVRTHVASILRKLGCDDRSSAVRAFRASQRGDRRAPVLTLVSPAPSSLS